MSLTDTATPLSLSELLRKLSELGGSDLHITTGSAPQVRVDGHLRPLEGYRQMTAADTKQLAYSVLTDARRKSRAGFFFWRKGSFTFSRKLIQSKGRRGLRLPRNPLRDQGIRRPWPPGYCENTLRETSRPDSCNRANRFG